MEPLPSIRRARNGDADASARFLAHMFVVAYGHCSTPGNIRTHVERAFSAARIADELAAADRTTLLAVASSGAIAGFAQLGFATKTPACVAGPAIELVRFYVGTEWHGSGLADALMAETLAAVAPARGTLWLSAWEEAPRALGFYRRNGFTVAGTTVFVVGDDPKQDLVMARAV
ncbi:MAG TPA: N-acetyltransferase [Xanthomonadales bacterium]|nr:N-acetyltransferase [Xanthomonadales bacterium]